LRCPVDNPGGINDTTINKGGILSKEKNKKKASEKKKPQHTLKEKRQLKKEKNASLTTKGFNETLPT